MKRILALLALCVSALSAPAASIDDWLRTTGTGPAHAQLQRLADQHAGWRMLSLAWTQPEQIAPAARSLGLVTVADAHALADRLRDAMGMPAAEQFTRMVNPAPLPGVSVSSMPRIQWADMQAAIKRQTLSDGVGWYRSDASFALPTKAQLQYIAAVQPAARMTWRETTQDCDDIVQDFRGWLAKNGMGNLAIGYASIAYYSGTTYLGRHAVAISMDADHKVWLIDPQTIGLHDPITSRLGGFVLATRGLLSFVMH